MHSLNPLTARLIMHHIRCFRAFGKTSARAVTDVAAEVDQQTETKRKINCAHADVDCNHDGKLKSGRARSSLKLFFSKKSRPAT